MRRNILIAAALAFLALGARANDGVELSLRSKALAAAVTVRELPASPAAAADATMPLLPVMGETEPLAPLAPRAPCALSGRDVCYDAVAGHIVVRPAREFMPRIDGLTAENLSVRHNRITFTYSFK